LNEEANLARTLESVKWADEVVVLDSGSTDGTRDAAKYYGAKIFVEDWKGFSAQKNSAIEKCRSEWILSLDADEEVSPELAASIASLMEALRSDEHWSQPMRAHSGFEIARRNHFLGRWIKHGGFYPDRKPRLFRKDQGQFEKRLVHESLIVAGSTSPIAGDIIHHAYPTLSEYIEHMNKYSSLGAEMVVEQGRSQQGLLTFLWNTLVRPKFTFIYNYILRGGFLDGREGLLLHAYHAVYVSWKYAKAWELGLQAKHARKQKA